MEQHVGTADTYWSGETGEERHGIKVWTSDWLSGQGQVAEVQARNIIDWVITVWKDYEGAPHFGALPHFSRLSQTHFFHLLSSWALIWIPICHMVKILLEEGFIIYQTPLMVLSSLGFTGQHCRLSYCLQCLILGLSSAVPPTFKYRCFPRLPRCAFSYLDQPFHSCGYTYCVDHSYYCMATTELAKMHFLSVKLPFTLLYSWHKTYFIEKSLV